MSSTLAPPALGPIPNGVCDWIEARAGTGDYIRLCRARRETHTHRNPGAASAACRKRIEALRRTRLDGHGMIISESEGELGSLRGAERFLGG
jgi:hypothetical protein